MENLQPLALIVRQAPYSQRSARTQLDVALAAATLELPLEVFFLGVSVWQIATERETAAAGFAGGLKGWGAVSQMTSVAFFAEASQLQVLLQQGVETVVAVEGLDGPELAMRWQACGKVMSL